MSSNYGSLHISKGLLSTWPPFILLSYFISSSYYIDRTLKNYLASGVLLEELFFLPPSLMDRKFTLVTDVDDDMTTCDEDFISDSGEKLSIYLLISLVSSLSMLILFLVEGVIISGILVLLVSLRAVSDSDYEPSVIVSPLIVTWSSSTPLSPALLFMFNSERFDLLFNGYPGFKLLVFAKSIVGVLSLNK